MEKSITLRWVDVGMVDMVKAFEGIEVRPNFQLSKCETNCSTWSSFYLDGEYEIQKKEALSGFI